MSRITSKVVVMKLKNMFARWGIPEEFVSDNGSQFVSSEFVSFSKEYGFKCSTSSPYHPQGNGEAESGVRIAKIILRQNEPFLTLMSYRATPTQATKATPSQLMMGRRIRTTVPTLETNLQPKWPSKEAVRKADDKAKSANKYFFDKRHGVNNLPPLERGDQVKIKIDEEKEWNTSATVVSNDLHDR